MRAWASVAERPDDGSPSQFLCGRGGVGGAVAARVLRSEAPVLETASVEVRRDATVVATNWSATVNFTRRGASVRKPERNRSKSERSRANGMGRLFAIGGVVAIAVGMASLTHSLTH